MFWFLPANSYKKSPSILSSAREKKYYAEKKRPTNIFNKSRNPFQKLKTNWSCSRYTTKCKRVRELKYSKRREYRISVGNPCFHSSKTVSEDCRVVCFLKNAGIPQKAVCKIETIRLTSDKLNVCTYLLLVQTFDRVRLLCILYVWHTKARGHGKDSD